MAALLNLENVWGTRSDWVIQARNRDGTVPTGFTGEEALALNVATRQGDPAVFSVGATWYSSPTGEAGITVTAANSQLLSAGQVYQGEVICTPPGGDPDCIILFTLTSLPAAGSGGLLLRSLVELDEAGNLLSILGTQQQDVLGECLKAATEALEALCRRNLVLTDFDRLYRPGRTRKIYLDTRPVACIAGPNGTAGLTSFLDVAGTVTNISSANQSATITMTPVSATQNTIAAITLNAAASGIAAAPIVLPLASYPTIGSLFGAINAAGNGWQANALNDTYALYASTRLNYYMGAMGCAGNITGTSPSNGQQVELHLYATDLWRYAVDPDRGIIELTQNMPEAFRYADRSFGFGFGWGWAGATEPRNANVRCQYRAGYAIAGADIARGYIGVPGTLKTACLMTAKTILEAAGLDGIVQSQSVTGRSYTLRSDASIVPRSCYVLLSREMNNRLGGWGSR